MSYIVILMSFQTIYSINYDISHKRTDVYTWLHFWQVYPVCHEISLIFKWVYPGYYEIRDQFMRDLEGRYCEKSNRPKHDVIIPVRRYSPARTKLLRRKNCYNQK